MQMTCVGALSFWPILQTWRIGRKHDEVLLPLARVRLAPCGGGPARSARPAGTFGPTGPAAL